MKMKRLILFFIVLSLNYVGCSTDEKVNISNSDRIDIITENEQILISMQEKSGINLY